MPKVKLGNQAINDNFRNVMEHMVVDTPRAKLCKIIGISESAFYRRKRDPGYMTVRELRILRNTGRVTDEQILSFIREEGKQ